ncbi:MAG: cupin domain-containing protein [Methanoculleaceae archaeon]
MTLFSFDAGEGLSEHTAPFDAVLTVLDGECRVTIGGEEHRMSAGETVILPAGVPHAVSATAPFKMSLTMIRGADEPEHPLWGRAAGTPVAGPAGWSDICMHGTRSREEGACTTRRTNMSSRPSDGPAS